MVKSYLTRYQIFSQTSGIMRKTVGQAYWHVMMIMLSNVKYITIVMPKNNGMKRSTLA